MEVVPTTGDNLKHVCFVTAIVDLSSRLDYPKRMSTDDYLDLFNYIVNLGVNCVLFLDRGHMEKAKIYANKPHIHVHSTSFDELRAKDLIPENGERLGNKEPRDVYSYAVVTNSKPFFIGQAAEIYPAFTHYVWVDAGIIHAVNTPGNYFLGEISTICEKNKPMITCMKHPAREDKKTVYTYHGGYIAARVIVMPKDKVSWFIEEQKVALEEARKQNRICLEEQTIAAIVIRNPNVWMFSYADYIASRSLYYIREAYCPLLTILHSYLTMNYANALDAIRRMLLSIRHFTIRLSVEETCKFLYFGFLCALHSDNILAYELAQITYCFARNCRWFDETCVRLQIPKWREHCKLYCEENEEEGERLAYGLYWEFL